jgi:hypothetical protein
MTSAGFCLEAISRTQTQQLFFNLPIAAAMMSTLMGRLRKANERAFVACCA